MPASTPPAAHALRIGRYEVVHPLGHGGMGRVLLARDTVLGRLVALKLLRDDLGLPPELRLELFDRMRNEARAAAAISHPNIVTLHDMGEEPAAGLYLVFEYVDGPTLRDRLYDGGRLEPKEVAALARQLGDALATAHATGVIHRDVKPENVLLAKSGGKIADFGIARLPDSTLTRAGVVLGTPAYSAPEALAGGELGPESDQFSLGATLYESISGARAFPGDDALSVAARIANDDPAPLAPSIAFDARGASAVLARAMSKDPKKRFASCRELGDALAAALERRASIAPPERGDAPPNSVTRSSISLVPTSTLRRQNIAAGAAALVILGLALFGSGRTRAVPDDGRPPGADEDDATASEGSASLKKVSAKFAAAIAPRAGPSGVDHAGRRSDVPSAHAGEPAPPARGSSRARHPAALEADADAPRHAALASDATDDAGALATSADAGGAAGPTAGAPDSGSR